MADKITKVIEVIADASSSIREFDKLDQASKRTLSDMVRLNEDYNKVLMRQTELIDKILFIEERRNNNVGGNNGRVVESGGSGGSSRYREEEYHKRYSAPQREQSSIGNIASNVMGSGIGMGGGMISAVIAGLGLGAVTSVMGLIVSSLREGENVQRSLKSLDSIASGVSEKLHRVGERLGYTDAEVAKLAKTFIMTSGQIEDAGQRTVKIMEYEKAFGVDTSKSLQLAGVSRMTGTSFENEFAMLFKSMSKSGSIDPSSRNFALFNEKLENLIRLIQFSGQKIYQPSGSMVSGVMGGFDMLGGSFADQRQTSRIQSISESISNPDNDFKRAFVMEAMVKNLSGRGKSTDYVSVMEQMEKGAFGEGNLKSVFEGLKERHGTGNEGIMGMQAFTGLGWGESRKLTEVLNSPDAQKFYDALDQYSETEAGSKEKTEIEKTVMNDFGINISKLANTNTTFVDELGATLTNTLSSIGSTFINDLSDVLSPDLLRDFAKDFESGVTSFIDGSFDVVSQMTELFGSKEQKLKREQEIFDKTGRVGPEMLKERMSSTTIFGDGAFGKTFGTMIMGFASEVDPEGFKNAGKRDVQKMQDDRLMVLTAKQQANELTKPDEDGTRFGKDIDKHSKTVDKHENVVKKFEEANTENTHKWSYQISPDFQRSVAVFLDGSTDFSRYVKQLAEQNSAPGGYKEAKQGLNERQQRNRDYAMSYLKKNYPQWAGQEGALDDLIMSESGWDNTIRNQPHWDAKLGKMVQSTAYGQYQFLDGTWGPYGSKTDDYEKQTQYGFKYIEDRYGNPNAAWRFKQKNNFYSGGGHTGIGGKFEDAGRVHKGEYVFTAEETQKYRELFDAIHYGKLPGYDGGGFVEDPDGKYKGTIGHSTFESMLKNSSKSYDDSFGSKIWGTALSNMKDPAVYEVPSVARMLRIFGGGGFYSMLTDSPMWDFDPSDYDDINGNDINSLNTFRTRDALLRKSFGLSQRFNGYSDAFSGFDSGNDLHYNKNNAYGRRQLSLLSQVFTNRLNKAINPNWGEDTNGDEWHKYHRDTDEIWGTIGINPIWDSGVTDFLGNTNYEGLFADTWDFERPNNQSIFKGGIGKTPLNIARDLTTKFGKSPNISGIIDGTIYNPDVEDILDGSQTENIIKRNSAQLKKMGLHRYINRRNKMNWGNVPQMKMGGWTGAGGLHELHENEWVLPSDVYNNNRDAVTDMMKGENVYNNTVNNSYGGNDMMGLVNAFKEIMMMLVYERKTSDAGEKMQSSSFSSIPRMDFSNLEGVA